MAEMCPRAKQHVTIRDCHPEKSRHAEINVITVVRRQVLPTQEANHRQCVRAIHFRTSIQVSAFVRTEGLNPAMETVPVQMRPLQIKVFGQTFFLPCSDGRRRKVSLDKWLRRRSLHVLKTKKNAVTRKLQNALENVIHQQIQAIKHQNVSHRLMERAATVQKGNVLQIRPGAHVAAEINAKKNRMIV